MYSLQKRRIFYRHLTSCPLDCMDAASTRRDYPEAAIMRHPALRRSARHAKRDARPANAAGQPEVQPDPAAQNRVAPDAPPDGEHNQGGVRQEGLEYQRDLGSEQDA